MKVKRSRGWLMGLLVTTASLAGCLGKTSGPVVGSESHFLRECTSTCGEGLTCLSRVCSRACYVGADQSCSELAEGAECTNDSGEPGEVAICDLACSRDAQCFELGGDYRCYEGHCRGPALATETGDGDGDEISSSSGGRATQTSSGGATAETQSSGGGDNPSSGGSGTGGALNIEIIEREGEPLLSCADMTGDECASDDCCTSLLVPGGSFTPAEVPVEMSAFYLDKFEVTVGRFRRYMEAVDAWQAEGNPVEGAGAHPQVPESGFKREWLVGMDPIISEGVRPMWLGQTVEGGPGLTYGNPTYLFGDRDDLPVNRVPFQVAFAFCIWDGGRLPTALEWLYTFQGGPFHTAYPWGDTPEPAEVWAVPPPPGVPPEALANDSLWEYLMIPVGVHPVSTGIFGHTDLVGGLFEYARDKVIPTGSDELIALDDDQIEGDPLAFGTWVTHVFVGTSWSTHAITPELAEFTTIGESESGFRCARDE